MRAALAVNSADPRLQNNAKFILAETPPPEKLIWSLEDAKAAHVHSPSLAELLLSVFPKEDGVIDFGCGLGYYVAFLRDHGYTVTAVEGTDGINEISLFKDIQTCDLSQPLSLNLPMSSVLCLEVGEHLLPSQEAVFLDNITRFCKDKMVLSWAVPGQGGRGHHNERPNEYLISQLAKRGFELNGEQTRYLRESYVCDEAWWLSSTLMVFNRS